MNPHGFDWLIKAFWNEAMHLCKNNIHFYNFINQWEVINAEAQMREQTKTQVMNQKHNSENFKEKYISQEETGFPLL